MFEISKHWLPAETAQTNSADPDRLFIWDFHVCQYDKHLWIQALITNIVFENKRREVSKKNILIVEQCNILID